MAEQLTTEPMTAEPIAAGAPLVIGLPIPATQALAQALGAQLYELPELGRAEEGSWPWLSTLEVWEQEFRHGPDAAQVVICTWEPPQAAKPLTALTPDEWSGRVELPIARWFAALRGALARCADGAAVVVVAERPAPIDSRDRADLEALADGLAALVRCCAFIVGERGIRVNLVSSAFGTVPEVLRGLAPPLGTFPGTVDKEVCGAVRLLLAQDAAGITGTTIAADCGRSW